VSNYDDQPITIRSASAKMISHRIIFPFVANQSATMYVGNDSAGYPRYDLARRLTNPSQTKTAQALPAALTENPAAEKSQTKQPWTEQHKILLLTVLVVVVFALGIFMLASLRTIHRQG
jgi:hypothetical protein